MPQFMLTMIMTRVQQAVHFVASALIEYRQDKQGMVMVWDKMVESTNGASEEAVAQRIAVQVNRLELL